MLRNSIRNRSLELVASRWSKLGGSTGIRKRWRSTDTTAPDEDEIAACRQWLAKFDHDTIPKRLCELSFSRSSGPGGQNVNKVSSKATLRVGLDPLLSLVPRLLHPRLRQSRYYAPNSDSFVIQADDSRKQAENAHRCYVRLTQIIKQAAEELIPGETSVEQKSRVKGLQQAYDASRLKSKKHQSGKKASRNKSNYD